MNPGLILAVGAVLLFAGMIVCSRVGRRAGDRVRRERGEEGFRGIGPIDGAMYALFGLLVAFSFSGATGRLDARRQLIVQEANAIGTAWLRVDLASPETQPEMRTTFRAYVDSRIETWRKLADAPIAEPDLTRTAELQLRLWSLAVAGTRGSQAAQMLLLPALNEAIDITTTRLVAWKTHMPLAVGLILIALAFACAWCTGFEQAQSESPSQLHAYFFAGVTTVVIYLTFDIEYPRVGFVHLDDTNQLLVDVRRSMD